MIWLFFVACLGRREDPRQGLLQSLGTDVFVATYQDLETKSISLHQGLEQFCSSPSVEELSSVQELWWAARGPWKQMEILKFGPYIEEPYRLGPKIDFWPVRPDTIDEVLAGDLDLTSETMRNYGTSSKGFPALEYLLYADHNVEDPRYCQYIVALGGDLVYQSTSLRKAWDPSEGNYLSNLTEAGEDGKSFSSTEEALAEVVNRLGHTLANIRTDKLRKPLGLDVGEVQLDKMESPYSHRSLRDILDNLEGIRKVYYGSDDGVGLSDYLQERGLNLDADFQAYLDDCVSATEAMDQQGSLAEAFLIDSESVLYLADRLGGLQSYIQVELMSALSLWLTFNDSDGD